MDEEDYRLENENKKFSKFGNHTAINVNSILNISRMEERVENGAMGRVIYQGWAAIGSSETEAVWLISKLNYDEDGFFIGRVWADGEDTFNKVWDSADTYTYDY